MKTNEKNQKIKYILIGIAIGIVIGFAIFYLLMSLGVIRPFFMGGFNPNMGGFPGRPDA